jgi:hypothetical protein
MDILASTSERILFWPAFWLIHLVPFGIPLLVWWVLRGRIRLRLTDACIAIIPFWLWACLYFVNETGKALSNVGVESMLIGGIAAALATMRILLAQWVRPRILIAATCLIATGSAALLWYCVPQLPE